MRILILMLVSLSAFSQKKDSVQKVTKIWILKFTEAGINTLMDVIDKSNAPYADEVKPLVMTITDQMNSQLDTALKPKFIPDSTKKKK